MASGASGHDGLTAGGGRLVSTPQGASNAGRGAPAGRIDAGKVRGGELRDAEGHLHLHCRLPGSDAHLFTLPASMRPCFNW